MLEALIKALSEGNDDRHVLAAIRNEIKEQAALDEAKEFFASYDGFEKLLMSEDPKIRKNAALLIGDLELTAQRDALFHAYEAETVLFVRSAYLKALEKMDCMPYLEAFSKRYEALLHKEHIAEEAKHDREERLALQKILSHAKPQKKHVFRGFSSPKKILLTTHPRYREITYDELPIREKKCTSSGVLLKTDSPQSVMENRTYKELLFPLKTGAILQDNPAQAARQLLDSDLLSILKEGHTGEEPFLFRVTLATHQPLDVRSSYAKKLAEKLEDESGQTLLNAPSDYEIELRFVETKESTYHVYLKLMTIRPKRFAYRKNSIAMTMKPSLAALLVRLAKPYLVQDAQLIDPFCGVGTLLIERQKLLKTRMTFGIDSYGDAILGARENTKLAGLDIQYVNRDYFDFTHDYLFDELMTDMPLRGKKTKEEQDAFYNRFFDKALTQLKEQAVMILYSDEDGFIKKQIRRHKELKLENQFLINERENACMYIIKVRSI